MTFDGFNAAVLIEPASTASLALQPNMAESPTLQDALSAKDDALPPDLWHVRTADSGPPSIGDTGGNQLRRLSDDEMLLVLGSNATVIGPDPWDWWDPTLPNDPDPEYPGGGGGSGGQDTSAHEVTQHTQDCGTDDGAAVQVAKHVLGTPPGAGPPNPLMSGGGDWTQVEYGAVIVRNPDGTYGALNDTIYSNGSASFVTLPGFAGTGAVGFWHDHTTRTDPNQQALDRYPSSQSGGDWDELQRLHDEVAPGDASFDPSMWLTGPDGVTREFKLSERSYYDGLSPEQMRAGEGLAGKERTQSCG